MQKIFVRNLQRWIREISVFEKIKTIRKMSSDESARDPRKYLKMRKNAAIKIIDTPEFHSIFTEELRKLIDIFKKYDYELRIAGGAVRDLLMSIKPKDIDLATTATPNEMKEMFVKEKVRMINTKGEKHGTITARINEKENYEVTTLRVDVCTDGRHAEVKFTTDWQLDANRRDLTINSMFLGFDGTLYDYFFGYEDIQQRRVVFVNDANVRIKEDYLRILRYFRFYGRIALNADLHDEATLEAISKNVDGLARISGERIWSELRRIVVGNFGCELVLKMIDCGLMPYCGLPKEPNIKEFKRLCADLSHLSEPQIPILYVIALLNTREDAIRLHERLKLSAKERDLALFITQKRDEIDETKETLHEYKKLCITTPLTRDYWEQLLKYRNKKELYKSLNAWKMPTFPINFHLLKEHCCPLDEERGVILSKLKLIWADSDFSLTAAELLEKYLPDILQQVQSLPPSSKVKGKSARSRSPSPIRKLPKGSKI